MRTLTLSRSVCLLFQLDQGNVLLQGLHSFLVPDFQLPQAMVPLHPQAPNNPGCQCQGHQAIAHGVAHVSKDKDTAETVADRRGLFWALCNLANRPPCPGC